MKVIFLDVDGVINSEQICNKKNGPRCQGYWGISSILLRKLKRIVDETGAVIILTSSWKTNWIRYIKRGQCEYVGIDLFGKYLHNKIRKFGMEISGTTAGCEMTCFDRGQGISVWLKKHEDVTHWVVLDDVVFDDYEDYGIMPHLVHTDEQVGLTDNDVEKAIKILNEDHYKEDCESFQKML